MQLMHFFLQLIWITDKIRKKYVYKNDPFWSDAPNALRRYGFYFR